jgi:hypothetical protein
MSTKSITLPPISMQRRGYDQDVLNIIPPHIMAIWNTFSPAQKYAIYKWAAQLYEEPDAV